MVDGARHARELAGYIMALKKCPECKQQVSSSAKTCPHCGKELKHDMGCGEGCLVVVIGFFLLSAVPYIVNSCSESPPSQVAHSAAATPPPPSSTLAPIKFPPFKIGGTYDRTTLSLVVAPNTSREDLKALLLALKNAREHSTFRTLGIPPTTEGGKKGPYATLTAYVMSDEKFASSASLKRYYEVQSNTPFEKDFGKKVLAYYFYSGIFKDGIDEEGSIGYQEGGTKYTKDYERLFFSKSAPPTVDPQKQAERDRMRIKVCTEKFYAVDEAKELVRNSLKAPSTATFPGSFLEPFKDTYAAPGKDCSWTIESYVDAQNTFGAMIRSAWRVKLQLQDINAYNNPIWTVKDIKIR